MGGEQTVGVVPSPLTRYFCPMLKAFRWLALGLSIALTAGLITALIVIGSGRGFRPSPPLPELGKVTAFSLTNEQGAPVSATNLLGPVWLADIIFTRCPGPCVRMTRQMAEIQRALGKTSLVRLVSLTADPAHDTPAVLKTYADRFGADLKRWTFLTGPKAEVYRLAMKDLLLAVEEAPPETTNALENLFIHSTKFILVDQQGTLRAIYDGEAPETRDRVLADVKQLLRPNLNKPCTLGCP